MTDVRSTVPDRQTFSSDTGSSAPGSTTAATAGPATAGGPLRPNQRTLVGLEGFVAVCGLGGGIFLITHAITAMPQHYLDGTWFATWRWPGMALLFFVGLCPALVAAATLAHRRQARLGHLCVGAGLVAWVALEAAWIVVSPGLQLAFGAIGVLILALGVADWRTAGRVRREG